MEDWEKIRMQNMQDLQNLLDEELAKPEMQQVALEMQKVAAKEKEHRVIKKRNTKDKTFQFNGNVPLTRRSSSRIANKKPEYNLDDLSDVETESGTLRRNKFMRETHELENLDEVVFRPKTKRKFGTRRIAEVPYVAAEDITENYIKNIAWRVIYKEYSADGTSCHQCRQKTKDSKTYCRSGRCTGIRGQFCGVCLKNRYGEEADVALRDPKWECPPCRNLCNCSICRTRQGKMPTGILAPVAQNQGFKSVADFLTHLKVDNNGKNTTEKKKRIRNIEGNLLGFDDSGDAVMTTMEE